MSFGQRLKTIRKSVGLTQADLADKLIEIVQSEVFYDDDEFDDEEE